MNKRQIIWLVIGVFTEFLFTILVGNHPLAALTSEDLDYVKAKLFWECHLSADGLAIFKFNTALYIYLFTMIAIFFGFLIWVNRQKQVTQQKL